MSVQVLAHRGASRAERENTVAAFERAAMMGADGAELDVRRTADDALVVHHDPRLGDGRIILETLAADLPEHVPTLSRALDACAGMWVNLEIKNDESEPDFDTTEWVAEQTMALLGRRGEPQRWLMSSFRIETMDRCRAIAPDLRTAWLTSIVPGDVVEILLAKGHVAGLLVNTWTCDDPARMRELAEWGIDGICTNVPDIARSVLDGSTDSTG